ARAALSRVLKDAVSFGMVSKQNHQLFLTDKGMAGLKVKMHDKLVLKLNQLMKIRTVAQNPDPLVQHLSILLERGKNDPRLMDNARAGVSFSVDDLAKVHERVQENIRHLSYVEKSLAQQVESLRGQNFPVSHALPTSVLVSHAPHIIELSGSAEVQVEHPHVHTPLENSVFAGTPTTIRGTRASVPKEHFSSVVQRMLADEASLNSTRAFMGMLTLDIEKDTTIVRGPSQVVEKVSRLVHETPAPASASTAAAVSSMAVAHPLPPSVLTSSETTPQSPHRPSTHPHVPFGRPEDPTQPDDSPQPGEDAGDPDAE
ncbi:MAG: hypothetical protein AABY11_01810, partial [archaeon]